MVQANTKTPWLVAKSALQLMGDSLLQQEMKVIKEATQCESFLYQGNDPIVVASSTNYVGINCPIAKQFIALGLDHEIVPVNSRVQVGSMYRFEVAGNEYILGLRGDLTLCDEQVKSSAERLKALL